MYKRLFSLIIALFVGINAVYAQEANWMPDPELRQAVREHLELSQEAHLTIFHLQELTDLIVLSSGISSLQGLEHAVNLRFLHITHSLFSDLTPIKNLVSLEVLKLWDNEISDIKPLANLANLEELHLSGNEITDISPLAELVNLRKLYLSTNQIEDVTSLSKLINLQILDLEGNLITDITPLKDLVSLEFLNINANVINASQLLQLDLPNIRVCDVPRLPVKDRIEDRDYPSAFAAWANIINLPTLSESQRYARHDLWFGSNELGLNFVVTDNGIHLVGNLQEAKRRRDALLSSNPNMILLVQIPYYGAGEDYPEDWVSWLRDAEGNRIQDEGWWGYLLDFTLPETQKWTLEHVQAVARCGLFDGIFLDHWSEGRRLRGYRTSEEEHVARDKILQGIRDAVGEDFLIMVNTNRDKIPRWAEYVNGTFMETLPGITFGFLQGAGYTRVDILEIEETLVWSEKNFREPRINGLEGWGLFKEPPDSLQNRQWMRLFTTMSLTLSDGYVLYVIGSASFFHEHFWYNSFLPESHDTHPHVHDHDHYWYDFWDADLGKPIGEKGVLYRNRDGLYIREYTNGWAVYNRSGTKQQIEFSEEVSGVESGVTSTEHTVPDLDGEIYLKANTEMTSPADVNKDRVVNILDLVLIAQHLGENVPSNSEVDVNGDGVVNILDLTFVAQHLGGGTAAAPATISETPDAAMIQAWIEQVQLENDGSIAFQYAIAKLQELLKSLIPEKTTLLPNYPNPFNPETWIPYHLANPSEVTISIYSVRGTLIRQLNLGHQHAGYYTDQSRAAYWDGRNEVGERVASGIYFYQLQADNLSFLRKMVILK